MILPEGVPVLETENLILRKLSLADSPELFAMRKDPRMHVFTDTKPDQTIEETEAYIKKMRKGADERQWLIWGIAHQKSNRLIGSISLWNFDTLQGTAELGYGVSPDYQGRGFMKEALLRVVEYAFQALRLLALEAYTEENNVPSICLLEACRFKAVKRVDDAGGDGKRIFHMVAYRLENPRNRSKMFRAANRFIGISCSEDEKNGSKIDMYELHQVTESAYYIQSPAKIGLIRLNETDVCLIDSGNDKDAGRKVRQILDANNWRLTAIYNTHSNADHVGGNKYLQTQTGCDIFAPGIERDFTVHPVLEPSLLYGGFPPKELRHKFLMAQESDADLLTEDALPEDIRMLPLPGHFFDMVGYQSADGAVFLADCLSSQETLEKYRIPFIYDVAAYLATLEMVKTLRAKVFIPAHAEVTDCISPLAQFNIDKVQEIADRILDLCKSPMMFETVLQRLFVDCGLVMNLEQYVLVGSTVRSYLAWLKDSGRLEFAFEDGQMLWKTIG